MQIGYVTFNTEERQRVMKVLQMVRDQTAIDELGLGRIRDAFANRMFPGMSTLQRRAKYFAVLPSLYYEASKLKYRNIQEVHQQIIHWEIRLTEMLLAGAVSQEDRNGITGSSMLETALQDESKFVRYDPTYIYQTGLRTYQMIRSTASLERLIFERSRIYHQLPEKIVTDTTSDADENAGLKQLFATSGEKYDFENGKILSVNLTNREAEFIKKHIILSPLSKESLFAFLLKHDEIGITDTYEDLSSICHLFPDEHKETYLLARHFSHWAYYIHLRYRYLFAEGHNDIESKTHYEELMSDTLAKYPEIRDSAVMIRVFASVSKEITDPTLISFCSAVLKAMSDGTKNDAKLDALIKQREKNIKGARYKIDNPKYSNYELGEPGMMSFRWNEIVYKVITEIHTALWHNDKAH